MSNLEKPPNVIYWQTELRPQGALAVVRLTWKRQGKAFRTEEVCLADNEDGYAAIEMALERCSADDAEIELGIISAHDPAEFNIGFGDET